METWSGGQIAVEAVTFSTAHQLIGATENWQKAFDAWLETSGGERTLYETCSDQLYQERRRYLRKTVKGL